MTPAEQARAEVEAWLTDDLMYLNVDADEADRLIARLTPVFERAQQVEHLGGPCDYSAKVDAVWKLHDALRERAERAEAALANEKAKWPTWKDLIDRANATAMLAIEKLDAAEAKQHATRDELNQRDGTIIDLRAALEIAEADRDTAQYALRVALQTERELEAEVAKLKEAFLRYGPGMEPKP